MRSMWLYALGATLQAASVETTLLGRIPPAQPPLTASDRAGNLIVAAPGGPCGFLQESCPPITLAKLDPAGKIVWRRSLGEPTWRIQISSLAVDPAGNIVLGAITPDSNLPAMRPVQPRAGGDVDVYLWQLSADGSRTTFATYIGGSGIEELGSLQTGPAGEILALIQTSSPNFPYTAQAGPTPPSQGITRWNALVRIVPSTGVMSYAIGAPIVGAPSDIPITPVGTARWVLPDFAPSPGPPVRPPLSILEIQPDGTRSRISTGLPVNATVVRNAASPDGGLWMTGVVTGTSLPTTPNALRRAPLTFTYARLEDRQRVTPSGPIQSAAVRLLAVDGSDRNRIFAATSDGVLRSEDNGWTWTVVNDTPPFRNVAALAAGAGRIWAVVLAASGPSLAYSDDAGLSWRAVALPSVTGPFNVEVHPTDRSVLFLGAGSGFFVTRDTGETWNQRQLTSQVIGVAVDPSAPDTVALTTLGPFGSSAPPTRILLISEDGGRSFPKSAPLPGTISGPSPSIQFDPHEAGRIYYTGDSSLMRTTKDTYPQTETLPFPFGPLLQFGFQHGAPGVILGISPDGALHRSDDGGRTWDTLVPGSPRAPFPQQIAVAAGGVVHVAQPVAPEGFVAKIGSRGNIEYLSYFGTGSFNRPGFDLFVDATGRLVLLGMTEDREFPGQRLRGDPSGLPPNLPPTLGLADIYVVTLASDGALANSTVLAGTLHEGLYGAVPGPGGSVLVLGYSASPDFPGLGSQKILVSDAPSVFLARLQP
ncbi:MAG: hypothetical protein ACKV22_17505 [Bryobacteraceae bacterium]